MRIVDNFEMLVDKPLDSRFSVANSSELEVLRLSSKSYPFMRVTNRQDGKVYELSADKSTWVEFLSKVDFSGLYTKSQVDSLISTLQGAIDDLEAYATGLEQRIRALES